MIRLDRLLPSSGTSGPQRKDRHLFFKRLVKRIGRRISAINWLRVFWETLKSAWWAVSGGLLLAVRAVVTVLLIVLVGGTVFATIFVLYVKTDLTGNLDLNLDDYSLNQTSVIYYYDKDRESWEVLDNIQTPENRTWVNFDDIPADLQHAVVSIEDKRFYKHHGVDWFRTMGAFVNMFLGMKDTYGGSTLTQQLIKNLTEENAQTVQRKLTEILKALEFEKNYTKDEIMTWYLNKVYFGNSCYGVSSAAKYYYGKPVGELTLAEMASIVAITNNPSIYDPFISLEDNKERQEIILSEMYKQKYITLEQYEKAKAQPLVLDYYAEPDETEEEEHPNYYSWFTDAVIEDVIHDLMELKGCSYKAAEDLLTFGGYRIYATVDMDIQTMVDSVYTDLSNFSTSSRNQLQSAIVITNPYTGDILAMAGGVGEKEGSRVWNRATMTTRPPGSSFKPLAVYSPAIEYGLITPDTRFEDDSDVRLKGTSWMPKNDSRSYADSGVITVRTALRNSVNTVAAQVLDLLTPRRSFDFLTGKLHFSTLVEQDGTVSDVSYAPLALGQLSYGVSVREMAAAYSIFDNMGIYVETRTYSRIEDANGVLVYENEPETNIAVSDTTAYWITSMLQDAVNSGTGTLARLKNMPVAGKTGTTSDNYDRWFVGYTPYYVAAVWSGYDYNERISYSGGNPSSKMWGKVMAMVHEGLARRDFPTPSSTYLAPVVGVDEATEYTIRCVTQTGYVLKEETKKKLAGKKTTIKAPAIDNYRCTSGDSMKVTISKNAFENVFEFTYVSTAPKDLPITIHCYDTGGALIQTVTITGKEDVLVTVTAPALEGYEVTGVSAQQLLVSLKTEDNVVSFTYEKLPEPTTPPDTTPPDTTPPDDTPEEPAPPTEGGGEDEAVG